MSFDLNQTIDRINSGESQRKVAESLNMGESTLRDRIKKAGFVRNENKKWVLNAQSETQKSNNQENKKVSKQEKNTHNNPETNSAKKEERKIIVKKVTYEIDEELHYELRMKAFKQKKNVSELVEKALRAYLREGK